MKRFVLLFIVVVSILSFCKYNHTVVVAKALRTAANNDNIVWYADLTQDGINEKIVVDLTYVDNPIDGLEKTVSIYQVDSQTRNETLIWYEHADTVHIGWNGIYLYEQDGQYYLMTWKPYCSTGICEYDYEIFSFANSGEKVTLTNGNLNLNMDDIDQNVLRNFINKVNTYLSKSMVLIDTDQGKIIYSTNDNPIVNLFKSNFS